MSSLSSLGWQQPIFLIETTSIIIKISGTRHTDPALLLVIRRVTDIIDSGAIVKASWNDIDILGYLALATFIRFKSNATKEHHCHVGYTKNIPKRSKSTLFLSKIMNETSSKCTYPSPLRYNFLTLNPTYPIRKIISLSNLWLPRQQMCYKVSNNPYAVLCYLCLWILCTNKRLWWTKSI